MTRPDAFKIGDRVRFKDTAGNARSTDIIIGMIYTIVDIDRGCHGCTILDEDDSRMRCPGYAILRDERGGHVFGTHCLSNDNRLQVDILLYTTVFDDFKIWCLNTQSQKYKLPINELKKLIKGE